MLSLLEGLFLLYLLFLCFFGAGVFGKLLGDAFFAGGRILDAHVIFAFF